MDKLGAPSFATTSWWGSSDFRRGEQKAFVYFILGGGRGLYSWGSFGYCVVVFLIWSCLCFGRANPFFLLKCIVFLCAIIPSSSTTTLPLFHHR